MACGLPVVVSTMAGISEYLTDGVDSLLLPEPQNPVPLCQILSRLAQDPEFCVSLGRKATEAAARLSWTRHAQAIYSLLLKLHDQPSAATESGMP